jgi:hypothetical protein
MTEQQQNYWDECLSDAFEGVEAYHLFGQLTEEQRKSIAYDLEMVREHYGMAFYSPPNSDRYEDIKNEYEKKYKELEREYIKIQR